MSDVDALIPANLEAAHIRGPQAKPSSESKFTRTTTRTGFLIAQGNRLAVAYLLGQTIARLNILFLL